jgi:hypothetical protein
MTHKNIKRFQMKGVIRDDSDIVRLYEQHVNLLTHQMRMDGYVPVLDIQPAWSLSYNGKTYDFLLTVHGVYYGRKRSKKIAGVSGLKEIMME